MFIIAEEYKKAGVYFSIDAMGTMDEVLEKISFLLEEKLSLKPIFAEVR